jgi:hypothetical protein
MPIAIRNRQLYLTNDKPAGIVPRAGEYTSKELVRHRKRL